MGTGISAVMSIMAGMEMGSDNTHEAGLFVISSHRCYNNALWIGFYS